MIPDLFKKIILIGFIVAVGFTAVGCASIQHVFTKAPPTSDDSWTDMAGGFPQH